MSDRRHHLRQTLDLRLTQRLALTPSLLQKIELLQLNKLELREMLNQELMENPLLEEVLEQETPREIGLEERNPDEPATATEEKGPERDSFEEIDFRYFFDEYLDSGFRNREVEESEKPSFEAFLVRSRSLADHLNWQLGLIEVDERTAEIARHIIGNLNEDGYLTIPLSELCQLAACSPEAAEAALKVVQQMDPVGVGARDLKECLSLQLADLGLENTLAWNIISNHLQLLEHHRFKEVASRTGASFEDVVGAMDVIKKLAPKPGQKYNPEKPAYVLPEVSIAKVDGEYMILQNDEGMPQLRLNPAYRDLLRSGGVSAEARSFIRERFRSAVDLLRSVNQRKQTIYKVCACIINRQREFLEKGPVALRPMLIKDVATELGVHSSTISRVVTNKYVDTPQGVMELRKFFTMGVENPDGEELSIVQVKLKIRKLIEGENRQKPFSDNQIGQLLRKDNVFITRRTVAKYREQMQIPGSRERKIGYLLRSES